MKMPKQPPSLEDFIAKVPNERIAQLIRSHSFEPEFKYLHWDKLLRYTPPSDLTHEEWWFNLKMSRRLLYKLIPLQSNDGQEFIFLITDAISEALHHADLSAGGRIGVPSPVVNPETRNQYYVASLMEEAITSSQLEGATTTREVAKKMIRDGRPPRDNSERMILNNFRTMQRIGELKDEPLTKQLIFELHRIVTEGTLDNPSAMGRFRLENEKRVVADDEGQVFHVPPAASELEARMTAMCAFANGDTPEYFVHPMLRSIMLHFWLAYDHPFADGNGRTARALFYWAMLHYGYWLCEYISISRIILKAPTQYARAFLYTETDDNDLTYFILYQIDVIRRALKELHEYIENKAAKVQAMEQELQGVMFLNHRQRSLISHAMRHPHYQYTIEGHKLSHNIVYQTARTDLLDLKKRGIFEGWKVGKTWYFTPVAEVEEKLRDLGN